MIEEQHSERPTKKSDLVFSVLDGETLVFDRETNCASCLNCFAAEVLALCDGNRSAADIARDLPLEVADIRLVSLAMADLQKAQLLQTGYSSKPPAFVGSSRREFLKQFGKGSAVAIPIVASITLPAAAQVVSCSGLGDRCDNNTNCCDSLSCSGQPDGTSICVPNP